MFQVRNAIQALQEMTCSTMHSQQNLGGAGKFAPARSIPNLQNANVVHAITDHYILARSSSHPPEIWGRQISVDDNPASPTITEKSFEHPRSFAPTQQEATQTDNVIDYETLEKIVLANPRIILRMLGIEMVFKNECEMITPNPSNLHTIPEVTSSPECSTPNIHELLHDHQKNSSTWSIDNSNIDNCRSTEALLASSYDDVDVVDPKATTCVTINDNEPSTSNSSFCNIVTSSLSGLTRKESRKEKKDKNCSVGYPTNFEDTDERCALLKNDQATNECVSPASAEITKRNGNLFVNRVPPHYRFSAGDADALEKGQIVKMVSSRSLRES
jgi:hypothetical protein